MISRRDMIKTLFAASAALTLPARLSLAGSANAIKRVIPSSGEMLPVMGMGSSRTFDVHLDGATRAQLTEVLRHFFDQGGAVIDSSPMYGAAESVLGELLTGISNRDALFAATKVWTNGKASGIQQMGQSMARMRVDRFDLMQIHNLRDWKIHIKTLKAWKEQDKIRYLGITTSHNRAHDELIRALKAESFDFVQFTYNIANRESEKRLLPLAQDRGIATLINRPFQRSRLFHQVKGVPLPEWAREFDCASWGQFFLKFTLSHPATTCVIPATSKPHHMADNMAAGFGRLPDAAMRKRMIAHVQSL
ncbi:MAG: aldo/keto reductase [Gammaproteobacteria bacterium]|nr:aldo/keto reductase [Gammaproteobacteria bacterium]